MAKPVGKDVPTVPPSFPVMPPPLDQHFTLPTIMTMQSQLGGIVEQLRNIEKALDEIGTDVKKHGKWIYAANAFVAVVILILGFLAPRIWDILLAKPPAH